MSKSKSNSSFLIPSIGDFLFIAVFLLISLYAGKDLLNDGDTGYHIRAGEYILKTLSIPRHDMFSYLSPALPWTAHEWLTEIIMAVIHGSLGLTGVVVFYAFLIALTSYLLFKIVHRAQCNILVSLGIVMLGTAASRLHWLARPHIFSFVFMVIWYYILDQYQYKNRKNGLYTLPLIMVLWANLHGGFMGGFILLGIYLLGNGLDVVSRKDEGREESVGKVKALGVTTAACVAVTLINPYGYHLLLFPFQLTSSKDLMDTVSEFLSPNFHESYVRCFEILLLVLIAALGFSKRKLNFIEAILITLFLYMSLYSARYIPLFAIIATPILSKHLNLMLDQSDTRFARFIETRSSNISSIDSVSAFHFWPVLSVLSVLLLVYAGKVEFSFDPKIKPVAAIEFLKKEKISGHMLNNDEFGDCLIYSASPMYKVFIDGRLDMYGVSRVKEYNNVTNFKQGWEQVLDKYGISWVIFGADAALSRHLLVDCYWKLIYADKVANIFVRNVPEHQHLIRKYPSVRPVPQDEKGDKA